MPESDHEYERILPGSQNQASAPPPQQQQQPPPQQLPPAATPPYAYGGVTTPPPPFPQTQPGGAPQLYPPISPVSPGYPMTAISPFATASIPPAPSDSIGCCDAKTMVLVSTSLLLICELVTTAWYLMTADHVQAGFSIGVSAICLLLYVNVLGVQSAPFYIVVATTMLIGMVAKGIYSGIRITQEFNATKCAEMKKKTPPFESYLMGFVIVGGLIQMYRIQNFNDNYGLLVQQQQRGGPNATDAEAGGGGKKKDTKKKGSFFGGKKKTNK